MSEKTEYVTISWQPGVIPFPQIFNKTSCRLDAYGFYAICIGASSGNDPMLNHVLLQYIGQAFSQTFRQRLKQPHQAYAEISEHIKTHPQHTPFIMLGDITSVQRRARELINDVESCLIFSNQPPCNTMATSAYNGRDMVVTNTGDYFPLRQINIGLNT